MVNVIFTQLVLFKLLQKSKSKFLSNSIVLFSIFFGMFIFTFNFHMNQIYYFISKGTFSNLVTHIISNYKIIIYWAIILPISLIAIEVVAYRMQLRKIVKRKLYHFLGLIIYIPGIYYIQSDILLFISFIILYLLIIIEIIRPKLTNYETIVKINTYLTRNIDERDHPEFILTHIFLLYGCFSSVVNGQIYSIKSNEDYLSLFILCIGDAFASIIGSKYGVTKLNIISTNKTLEGFLAAGLSTGIFIYLFSNINTVNMIIIICSFIYELITKEIDNLVLPLFCNKLYTIFSHKFI